MFVACFAAVVVGYFILKEVWMRWNYDLHKIPSPPSVPFLGHAIYFWKGKDAPAVNIWLKEWREKLGYPKLIRAFFFSESVVFVADINILRNVVLPKTGGPPKGWNAGHLVQRLMMGEDKTPCMFTTKELSAPYVKTIRRVHFASFTAEGLKTLLPKQIETIKHAISFVESKRVEGKIDVQDLFTKMTLDLILKTAMDLDLGIMNDLSPLYELIIKCGHKVQALAVVPFLELKTKVFPSSTFAKKVEHDFEALYLEWYKIAQEVDNRNEPEPENIAFWANLKRAKMPGTDKRLPFHLLLGELSTTVLAGMDTTGHQLGWIFALLATNPQVVEKLLDELRSHGLYGERARDVDYEDFGRLVYLAAVVKEGMRRMHVLTTNGQRIANKRMVVDGYRIPKGTTLILLSGTSMNSENEWEDHLAFKPERWLNNGVNLAEKYYVPFSAGERDCAGQKLAIQTMRLAVLYFVKHYSFELVDESVDSLASKGIAGIVFEARDGINLKFTPRAKS